MFEKESERLEGRILALQTEEKLLQNSHLAIKKNIENFLLEKSKLENQLRALNERKIRDDAFINMRLVEMAERENTLAVYERRIREAHQKLFPTLEVKI